MVARATMPEREGFFFCSPVETVLAMTGSITSGAFRNCAYTFSSMFSVAGFEKVIAGAGVNASGAGFCSGCSIGWGVLLFVATGMETNTFLPVSAGAGFAALGKKER